MSQAPLDRDAAIACIRASACRAFADEIIEALTPSVRLLRERVEEANAPIGASRFGGAPDVPPGFEWPTWKFAKTRGLFRRKKTTHTGTLDFLAQINLAELPAEATPERFPDRGMLYVFYDTEEMPWGFEPHGQDGVHVLFVESPAELTRTLPPASRGTTYAPCLIEPTVQWTLPMEDDLPLPADADDGLEEAYIEEVCVPVNGDPGSVVHRMFGHAQWIQSDDTDRDANERLFLQIDSDDGVDTGPGWMWGDAGRLYLLLTDEQLAARRLAEARMTLQCY